MSRPGRAGRVRAALLALLLAGAAGAGPADVPDTPQPDPALSPQEVVRIQLEALKANDAADNGIAVAFRFASPDNRRQTGPLPRFARMIKDGPYALMLRYREASFAPVRIVEGRAAQRVTLVARGVAPVTYVFYLSRQEGEGPYRDCWMTDAVQVLTGTATQA